VTPSTNHFRKTLESGHFVVTAELTPPRGTSLESLTVSARDLKPVVTAVNLTDGAGARVRMAGLAAAIHLKQLGVEPILQVTCRDRNRIALQSDLLGAAAFGIENVLVLSGDAIASGDHPDAVPVFDLDVRALLDALQDMTSRGKTLSGADLTSAPRFFAGAADSPFGPDDGWSSDGLRAKHAAGAHFVQTQYCFDIALLKRYVDRLRNDGLTRDLYVLVGLGPLRSAAGALWMRDHLPGTIMPDGVVRRMEAARDPRHEGIKICAELMQQVRDIEGIAGVHLMAPGQHQAIVEAVKLAGIV
jgi:methylenetetrahydrofolate reductase (NADPH)